MADEKKLVEQIYDLIVKEYPEVQKSKDAPSVIKKGWYRVFRTNKSNLNVASFYLDCFHSTLERASGDEKTDRYGNEFIGIVYIESN